MRQCVKVMTCLALLLALCGCGRYESRVEGAWEGGGSVIPGVREEERPPFEEAERWRFDGNETAIATVGGKQVECRYSMTDDTLTLNAGGEASWGVLYE